MESYLKKLLHKEAFDRKGLIYGMGHAVYSKSDPRAEIFKRFVRQLSEEKGRMEEFALYSMIEELGPKVITEERRIYKGRQRQCGLLQRICIQHAGYSGRNVHAHLCNRQNRGMERAPH